MPDAKLLILKLIADRRSRKLLGVQAVGSGVGDKRVDVAAIALTAGWTAGQLAHAYLCYAPPFVTAIDNILCAANVMRNKLNGYMDGISAQEVRAMQQQKKDFVFLDVRSSVECEKVRLPGSVLIPLGVLRERLHELPKDAEIVTFCKISLRGYEATLILKAAGFGELRGMEGGVVIWPYEKIV